MKLIFQKKIWVPECIDNAHLGEIVAVDELLEDLQGEWLISAKHFSDWILWKTISLELSKL